MILINPRGQKIKRFYRYLPVSPHTGIGILAACLLRAGKTVKIIDENVTSLDEVMVDDYVKDMSRPYIFGISCVTAAVNRGYQIAKVLKAHYPDSKVIFGGIHPTVLPEEVLSTGSVDIVVRGEGEEILLYLYDAIKNGKDYSHLRGISFRNKNGILHNPDASLVSDIDSLPPFPYELFKNMSERYTLGFIVSSRGCPYDCIFCSQRLISGRAYRYIKLEKVMEELDLLINKYNQREVDFMDDNFVVNKKRVYELCNFIIDRGFHKKCSFHFQARGDSVDENMLRLLLKANFKYIDFGIETASERLMKLINKQETVNDNINAVRMAKKLGFQVSATFILGLPTETKEERRAAYKLAKELDIDFARFNNATPYPGTKLYKIAEEEGTLNIEKGWTNLNACASLVGGYFDTTRLAYVPKGINEKELKRDIFKANVFFYFRPKTIFRVLKKGMIPEGWLVLPKRWYLKPKEIYNIFRLLLSLLIPERKGA
jgi:anaerobic magnesium-protoporphyrin IX monomethyl ester cyclase